MLPYKMIENIWLQLLEGPSGPSPCIKDFSSTTDLFTRSSIKRVIQYKLSVLPEIKAKYYIYFL